MWQGPDPKLKYIKYVVCYLTIFVSCVGQVLPPSVDYKLKVKHVTYNVTTMSKCETTYTHNTTRESGWETAKCAAPLSAPNVE